VRVDAEEIMNSVSKFTAADLEAFARLGIPAGLLARAGVERVTDHEAREQYGISGYGDRAGIAFPYFDPLDGQRRTARLRRDNPEMEDSRPKSAASTST
jgi:hypothetical protein